MPNQAKNIFNFTFLVTLKAVVPEKLKNWDLYRPAVRLTGGPLSPLEHEQGDRQWHSSPVSDTAIVDVDRMDKLL